MPRQLGGEFTQQSLDLGMSPHIRQHSHELACQAQALRGRRVVPELLEHGARVADAPCRAVRLREWRGDLLACGGIADCFQHADCLVGAIGGDQKDALVAQRPLVLGFVVEDGVDVPQRACVVSEQGSRRRPIDTNAADAGRRVPIPEPIQRPG